ncbi:ABC transporter substrate-binding protein [Novosphingobium aquimarinum]|uniref:ABC transporter substrate-binding protein n=1 Tax=Novosphingobium aquimarinum TaxID=2682494 RepID=UPI0012EC6B9C|nr:ABC transporter substrate-binding protein [Novosphingobium aquimarinum]
MKRLPVMILGLAAIATTASLAVEPKSVPTAGKPQRIVSLNLCADQLILALADREQIAGLTRNVTDEDMSAAAGQVRGLRVLRASVEEILAIDPDLVIGMPASGSAAVAMLPNRNVRTLDLGSANSLDEIYVSIRDVAAAVGHPERGEALVARMQRELAAIPRNGGARVAAYYQRRGYMTGTGTLIDDLMQRVGLQNLAAKLGKPPLANVSLEEIVAAQPEYLIVESATARVRDQGTEMLHHPALDGFARISIPQSWTVCGGPAYVKAARSIADQLAAEHRTANRPQKGG